MNKLRHALPFLLRGQTFFKPFIHAIFLSFFCLPLVLSAQIAKDTLRITNVTGDTMAAPTSRLSLMVTIKNTGTKASSPSRQLQVFYVLRGCSDACCGCRVILDSMSNTQELGQAINPNDSITVPITFTMSPNFTHKRHFQTYFPNQGTAIGFTGTATYVYYGNPVFDTLFYNYPLKAKLPNAKLAIMATPIDSFLRNDSTIRYIVTVQNKGSAPIRQVETELYFISYPVNDIINTSPDKGNVIRYSPNRSSSNNQAVWYIDTLMPNESSRCTVVIKSFVYYYSPRVSVPVKTQSIYYDNDFFTEATVVFVKAPTTYLRDVPMNENNLFRVLPNPVSQALFLELESTTTENILFICTNTVGQVVFSEKKTIENGLNRFQFDVSILPKGVYFIRNGRNTPVKFVKM